MSSYVSNKPLHQIDGPHRRCTVTPSSAKGYVNITFDTGTRLSVAPPGIEVPRTASDDGAWEQFRVIGNRAVVDYEGIDHPVMYDIVVLP